MKKNIGVFFLLTLFLLSLSSCASFFSYKVKEYYYGREGLYVRDLNMTFNSMSPKWGITLRSMKKKPDSKKEDYQIVVNFRGEKKMLMINQLVVSYGGKREVFDIHEHIEHTGADATIFETAKFNVSEELMETLALVPDVKIRVKGNMGYLDYTLKEKERDGVAMFLFDAGEDEEKEEADDE